MYSAPLLCFLVALCLAVGPSSLAQVVLQPESLLSVDCPTQPYAALSGASGLLAAASGQPAFVATLGSSPILYASDVWGASQKPVPLRASLSPTANLAATNARLRGAARNGNSLFLVFSRDEGLGIASILQIDGPFSGSPSYRFHSLGEVMLSDVVASPEALYLLVQPKDAQTTNLFRFDLARGSFLGVSLPLSGGKLTLTPDMSNLLAAGPANNASMCSNIGYGCSLTYTFDPVHLAYRFASSYNVGCYVTALDVTPRGDLFLAGTGGQYCDTILGYGYLSNYTWIFSSTEARSDVKVDWAVPNTFNGFLEGRDGQVYSSSSKTVFTLQTDEPVSFRDRPIVVNDPTLGPCLIFPAVACVDGTLSLYVFTIRQFVPR